MRKFKRIVKMSIYACVICTLAFTTVYADTEEVNIPVEGEMLEEKMDEAIGIINSTELDDMKAISTNEEKYIERYDLGDGYELLLEMEDKSEDFGLTNLGVTTYAAISSGSNSEWKEYGNRYFTAKATIKCNGGTVVLKLENHYILSAKGIEENYGTAKSSSSIQTVITKSGTAKITDKSASTAGSSDVNMQADYTVKAYSASGSVKSTSYRMKTTVGYVSIDKTNKKIKVKQSWSLDKI